MTSYASPPSPRDAGRISPSRGSAASAVRHWYDFVCPFCYVAQARNVALRAAGAPLVEMPFEAHPETPLEGRIIGQRSGPMYALIEEEARLAGLSLNWQPELRNSRIALTMSAYIETLAGTVANRFRADVFAAHFERREDIGDLDLLFKYANDAGVVLDALHAAVRDGQAAALLAGSESIARNAGVSGTPAWLLGEHMVVGLLPASKLIDMMKSNFAEKSGPATNR